MNTPPPTTPEAPPLISTVLAASSFARQAALFSFLAPFVSIGINICTRENVRGNRVGMIVLGGICTLLIVAGFVLGIVALVGTRKHGRKGIFGRSIAGICINGVIILLMLVAIPSFIKAAQRAKEMQSQGLVQNADQAVTIAIPDGWDRRAGVAEPIMIAAVERGTGNSLGLLRFKQPDGNFTLNRKEADIGVLKELKLGMNGRILRRVETKLLNLPAYCVIGETEYQGRKISMARIMMTENPINGFMYAVQYSKMGGGDFDDAFIQGIADRVQLEQHK